MPLFHSLTDQWFRGLARDFDISLHIQTDWFSTLVRRFCSRSARMRFLGSHAYPPSSEGESILLLPTLVDHGMESILTSPAPGTLRPPKMAGMFDFDRTNFFEGIWAISNSFQRSQCMRAVILCPLPMETLLEPLQLPGVTQTLVAFGCNITGMSNFPNLHVSHPTANL